MKTRDILNALFNGSAKSVVVSLAAVGFVESFINTFSYADLRDNDCANSGRFYTNIAVFGTVVVITLPLLSIHAYMQQNSQAETNAQDSELQEIRRDDDPDPNEEEIRINIRDNEQNPYTPSI